LLMRLPPVSFLRSHDFLATSLLYYLGPSFSLCLSPLSPFYFLFSLFFSVGWISLL
jgi:hypothetical protein